MWCSGTREFNGCFGFLNATICERRKIATSVTKSTSLPKTGSSYCCPFDGPQTPIRSVWRCAVAGSRCASRCATTRRVLGDAAIIWWWRPKKRKWLWINTYRYIFSGMNIHLPAILMFTRGTRFWHTAKSLQVSASFTKFLLGCEFAQFP